MSHSIAESRAQNPMWVYEHNYVTLLGLFPFLGRDDRDEVYIIHSDRELQIKVLERCPYTLTIVVVQQFNPGIELLQDLKFKIRLYRDARLAEVVSYQDVSRLQTEYTYPNKRMFQPDEKYQVNVMLNDWLASIIVRRHHWVSEELDCSNPKDFHAT